MPEEINDEQLLKFADQLELVAVELAKRCYFQASRKMVSAANTIRWVTAEREADLNEVQIVWWASREQRLMEEKYRLHRIREVLDG